ncbi:hypothetical protein B0T17DRAFT_502561 [Bombardia bombarda]|uniref:Rhodopsin domain-containing protein n=1 Tax=Bombardia bombarda TaxID=252184 RepID=A0AA40CEZ7_9PEZI|nr:hypothetical protein B0T17DRAFT_502561 [Bombardia bombarda]
MTTPTPYLSGGPVLLSISLGTTSLAFATTFVRFCVRHGISKRIYADDYASLLATLVALIATIFGIIESTSMDPSRALEFDILGQPWYLMSDTLSKISISLFFVVLLGRARQWRILLGIIIFLMAAVNLTFSLTVNLQCRPLEKLWRPSVDGVCWDPSVQLNFGYFQGAFSVFSWFFLALFPVLIVRGLRIDGNVTWPFYVSSSLSFACGIFSIVRTAETSQLAGVSVYTYNSFCASIMANLEQNIGLIAANVLTLGPLFSADDDSRHPPRQQNSRAGSKRTITRGTSSSSRASFSRRPNSSSSSHHSPSEEINIKRTTHLIIQGPRRMSSRLSMDGGGIHDDDNDYDWYGLDSIDLEAAWPRGIIKTVSVEVVEEPNPDHIPGSEAENANNAAAADREKSAAGAVVEQDWEAMLRAGPPGNVR